MKRSAKDGATAQFGRVGPTLFALFALLALLGLSGAGHPVGAQESDPAVDTRSPDFEFGPTVAHPYGRPNPDAPAELDQYAFMIGDFGCDLTYKEFKEGAWVVTGEGRARWVARYAMNGRAIMDEFIDDWGNALNVRMFDPESGKWVILYSRVDPPSVVQLSAESRDGRMTMITDKETPGGYKYLERVSFELQAEDRYRWTQEVVYSPESAVVIADISCVRESGPLSVSP